MAKIVRKTQLIFGSAAPSQLGQFGSLAAGTAVYSADPAVIQSLSNYLNGWVAAILGGGSPAIEDMNGLCYLFAYQLAYNFQMGVAEWDAGTTYFTGSLVNDGTGATYASVIDNNTNQAVSVATAWRKISGSNLVSVNPATTPVWTMTAADNGKTFLVNSNNGAMQFTLPAAATSGSFEFGVKDVGVAGNLPSNPITIARNASESIEGLAANYVCQAAFGEWYFGCDATNWWIVGR